MIQSKQTSPYRSNLLGSFLDSPIAWDELRFGRKESRKEYSSEVALERQLISAVSLEIEHCSAGGDFDRDPGLKAVADLLDSHRIIGPLLRSSKMGVQLQGKGKAIVANLDWLSGCDTILKLVLVDSLLISDVESAVKSRSYFELAAFQVDVATSSGIANPFFHFIAVCPSFRFPAVGIFTPKASKLEHGRWANRQRFSLALEGLSQIQTI
ncbi:MAG: hypothetical protein HQ519_04000 [Planctomycetes bacterium]|nr:hypothetical protein [Planctomycetota bacterium]